VLVEDVKASPGAAADPDSTLIGVPIASEEYPGVPT
jgi:hypothetical protein